MESHGIRDALINSRDGKLFRTLSAGTPVTDSARARGLTRKKFNRNRGNSDGNKEMMEFASVVASLRDCAVLTYINPRIPWRKNEKKKKRKGVTSISA